ncbi:MAG: phage tail tape measure protein, partial [Candidatus Hodarchaeales archaeon]
MKFEDAILDLQKVMSDTEGDAKRFTGTIDEMSVKFNTSGADLLQGVANFKQAAFGLKESFDLQAIASKTAVAGNIEHVESAQLITRALKGFKAPASEAARLTDIANAVSNKYATSLKELLIAMSKASATARNMGFSFEETAAVLTQIIQIYGSGSEAATAFRTGMLKITSGSKKVREAFEKLGLDDFNMRMATGKELLFKIIEAFKDLVPQQKIFFAQQLVGVRQADRFSEILTDMSLNFDIFTTGMKAAGSINKEYGVKTTALSFKLGVFSKRFLIFARSIGEFFRPHLIKALDKLTFFIEKFKKGGSLQFVADTTKALALDMVLFFATIAKGFELIVNTIEAVAKKIKELKGVFDNPLPPPVVHDRTLIRQAAEVMPDSFINTLKRNREAAFAQEQRNKALVISPAALGQQGTTQQILALQTHSQNIAKVAAETAKKQADQQRKLQKAHKVMLLETQELFDDFTIAKERLSLNSTKFALAQMEREAKGYEELVKRGRISAEELKKFRIDATQAIELENSTMFQNMAQAANRFGDDISDVFADFMETGKFSFQSMATDFARMINKMIFQVLVIQPIMDSLFGSAGGG